MKALIEKRKELDAKRDQLAAIFKEAGPDLDMDKITSIEGDSAAKAAHIRSLNDEMADLGKQVDELAEVERAAKAVQVPDAPPAGMVHPNGDEPGKKGDQAKQKSLGELFVESDALKGKKGPVGPTAHLDIELKTLFTTSAGWAPETTRGPRVVDFVTRPLQVIDTIPTTTTSQAAIKYMEETTFTNAAAEVAEGGTKPEAALALTERIDPVQKIAVWLPVTDEQLEDVPQVRGYIDNRLVFMVRQRLDGQILVGNGTAPNLSGILDRAGIQTQAKGTDPVPDAIYKAIVKVRLTGAGNGGAMANVVYMHPLDWQDVRLLRTADGIYIWGSPADPGPERIWGLPVVLAEALTEGTGLVGDTSFAELAIRRGVDVQVSNSHGTFFVENKQAIRAEMRAALVVYRPAAFCQVTGI